MPRWTVVALLFALLLPAAASAQVVGGSQEFAERFANINAHPAECSRLRRQISQYANMYERAVAVQHQPSIQGLERHLGILLAMQEARCPDDVPIDHASEAFKEFLKLAAKAAVAYFTFGAAGF